MREYGSLTTDYLASSYSADEKLSLVTRHRGFSSQSDDSRPGARGVWEQTRYDAIGRRVASYAVRGSACPVSESESAIERTVWDGDQVLGISVGNFGDSSLNSSIGESALCPNDDASVPDLSARGRPNRAPCRSARRGGS